ncbi:MAG: hypothetical protein FWG83_05205 [Oscillospiraceae bacterium]|nr:hypothetical protein [Oscillospiraceae bacterium]
MSCHDENRRMYEQRGGDFVEDIAGISGRGHSACVGIREVKEGCGDINMGLREIDKAQKNVDKAIHEVEKALKELKCCQQELRTAGRYEREGLGDIDRGIRLIEDELKKPIHIPPICRG